MRNLHDLRVWKFEFFLWFNETWKKFILNEKKNSFFLDRYQSISRIVLIEQEKWKNEQKYLVKLNDYLVKNDDQKKKKKKKKL